MTYTSSYLKYLPPVLWSRERDPTQFLGRMLRIFEKILTGIPIETCIFKAEVSIVNANNITIQLSEPDDAAKFKAGDIVSIKATEQAQIDHVSGANLILTAALNNSYIDGTVRLIQASVLKAEASIIAANNVTIQVTNPADAANFQAGDVVSLAGTTTERVEVERVSGANIILVAPVSKTYTRGTIRIANLIPGQTIFRVDDSTGLRPGLMVKISQGRQSEERIIAQVIGDFVTLMTGLSNTYTLDSRDVQLHSQEDKAVLWHGNHEHEAIKTTLDELSYLFNPWRTQPDFLPWLASWLSFTLLSDWDEYQQRKLISEITSIYQQRGMKQGMLAYLDIFAVSKAKPRVVIDDGDTIFRIVLRDNQVETVHAIASGPPLLYPMALAIDSLGNYVITDQGDEGLAPPAGPGPIPASLWRISATGESQFTNTLPPEKVPIHQGTPLFTPTGVVVETTDAYVVVDTGPERPPGDLTPLSGIYRFSPPTYSLTTVIDQSTVPSLPAVYPVDMVRLADGEFAVLDRGARFLNPASPQIIIVREGPPLTIESHSLDGITEPTALALDATGNFLVIDAGLTPPTPSQPDFVLSTVQVYLVDISTTPATKTSLLPDPNVLIYPTALVLEDENHILISDVGVKPPGRFAKLAKPASLYRIPLPPAAPVVEVVSRDSRYVVPSDLAVDPHGEIILLDGGESQDQAPARSWRALTNEFGVVVYFPEDPLIDLVEKQRILRNIARIVDIEKPVHTYWTLKTNQI